MASMASSLVRPLAGLSLPVKPAQLKERQVQPKCSSCSALAAAPGSAGARPSRWSRMVVVRAVEEEAVGSAASATSDSVVAEVAVLPDQPPTPSVEQKLPTSSVEEKLPTPSVEEKPPTPSVEEKAKRPGPLEKGGTLSGAEAEGKDPSPAALGIKSDRYGPGDKFEDPRWRNGTWDLAQFTNGGKTDWDAVIDAEVLRRKWLEDNPEASSTEDPVIFETSIVPWWAWVRRFHLPEAEVLNGRAAMVGYASAFLVDSLTGVGLVDQQNSFLGKLLLLITIGGVLFVRKNDDVSKLKALAKEWTFYDSQWQASWKDEKEKSKV